MSTHRSHAGLSVHDIIDTRAFGTRAEASPERLKKKLVYNHHVFTFTFFTELRFVSKVRWKTDFTRRVQTDSVVIKGCDGTAGFHSWVGARAGWTLLPAASIISMR